VYVNYWYEKLEDWQVEAIGADNILFETDFPHPTCFYKDDIDVALQNGLPDQPIEVQEKILWRNAAELYGLDI
jgi:predicted TIM-barrel fold metal-dependent hydrolase